MSEILAAASAIKEIGVTALVVGAAIWLLASWLPKQSRAEGEVSEVIRQCIVAIDNNTRVLEQISIKDEEVRQALGRIEHDVVSTSKDVRYLKISCDAQASRRKD